MQPSAATLYPQRDPRWAHLRLGTPEAHPDSTIGAYGCLLSCFASLATRYGHPITPPDLNTLFADRGLFIARNLLADSALAAAFPDLTHVDTLYYYDSPADLDRLRFLLSDPATSVILELDFNHSPSDGTQPHFVVAAGCDGRSVTVADPWYGEVEDLTSHYGPGPKQVIQKFVVYRGPAPSTGAPPAPDLLTPDQLAILHTMAALNAKQDSIDAWLSKIGRAAEIGRILASTKRLPRATRPLVAELAAIAG